MLLSFPINDIQPRRGSAAAIRRDSASMSTGAGGLSGELQEYQTSSIKLKEKVTELRRQKAISPIQKQDLDAAIKELQAREIRLKNQLESQMRGLDQLPRTEIAQKRIALGKLSKDFDRVKSVVTLMMISEF